MRHRRINATSDRRLQEASDTLNRAAGAVRYGLFAVGIGVTLQQVAPMISDAQFTWGERRVAGIVALITLGSFAVAGWIAGSIARAAASMLGAVADATEAAVRASDLIESQLVPAMNRVAIAIEGNAAGARPDPSARLVAEIQKAIRDARWSRAEGLIDELGRDHPRSPDRARLAKELADAMNLAAETGRRHLDAAIQANDPDAAIDARDTLTLHLRGASLHDLDLRVARWLVGWVRGQVRRGSYTTALAEVAAKGADRFSDTPEGQWLVSALPDLRRQAGLCAVCARPHAGDRATCPACSASASATPPNTPVGSRPKGST